MTLEELKQGSCDLAADLNRSDKQRFSMLHQAVLVIAAPRGLNAWKGKNCETCRFRVERRCQHSPNSRGVYDHEQQGFSPACAQHREEGEE